MSKRLIYEEDAIDALKAMALPLYLDSACEDIWERDRTLNNAIDVMRGLPSAQPEKRTEERTETRACDSIGRQAVIDLVEELETQRLKGDIDLLYAPMIKGVRALPPAQQWIPTSEKLPEYDKPVLLSTAWGKTEIGFWTQHGWMIVACSYREFEQDVVTAWMPLPEPYKGAMDVKNN